MQGSGGDIECRCDWFCDLVRKNCRQQKLCVGPKFRFFESELLETLGDGLIYSPNTFLGVEKHHVFRKKKLGVLGDARQVNFRHDQIQFVEIVLKTEIQSFVKIVHSDLKAD